MEVGQHRVDRAKAITGGNEQIGLTGEFRKRAIFRCRAFQKPQRSRADRYNATTRATFVLSAAAITALTVPHSGCIT